MMHFMPASMPMTMGRAQIPSQSQQAQAKRSSWSPSVSNDAKENQAGVGILFVEEEDPSGFVRVTVKALIEGGSAERTGMVRAGDMVVRVGNQDVIGKPLSVLRTMIPGPIGSYCRLGFLRGGVALNSNAVQEKSTYYDVQLLRQTTKNEKRKLVPGVAADATAAPRAASAQAQANDRASLSQSMDKAGSIGAGMRDSAGSQPPPSFQQSGGATSDKIQTKVVSSPASQPAPQRATTPSSQTNPALSQSFEQRSMSAVKSHQKPQQPADNSPNALRSSVDAAINNVDRALSEMHKQEVDRLKDRIEAAERGRASAEEELRKERAARKQQDEKVRDLEQRVRSLQTQTSPPAMSGTPEKRKLDLLEKQVAQLKQDKQREEMRRLEAESTLKSVERRANELHSQMEQMHLQGRGGVDPSRLVQLEQQLQNSEERRKEEEKKRAIAEGKHRHLENQLKQQSPFKYASMYKGKKGPPSHMPDISEGKEMQQQGLQAMPNSVIDNNVRSPSLQAIDGPLPDALMGQGQYAAGRQQLMHVPAAGATGMMMSPGQAVSPQHHMGIPGVDIYSSQGSAPAANPMANQQQRMQMIQQQQVQAPQQAGSAGRGMMQVPVQPVSGGAPTMKAATPQLQQQQLAQQQQQGGRGQIMQPMGVQVQQQQQPQQMMMQQMPGHGQQVQPQQAQQAQQPPSPQQVLSPQAKQQQQQQQRLQQQQLQMQQQQMYQQQMGYGNYYGAQGAYGARSIRILFIFKAIDDSE